MHPGEGGAVVGTVGGIRLAADAIGGLILFHGGRIGAYVTGRLLWLFENFVRLMHLLLLSVIRCVGFLVDVIDGRGP